MKKRTTEEFIELAKYVHCDKYYYDKTIYSGKRNKVVIICPIHGEFEQFPNHHLNGCGCPKCARILSSDKERKYTTETFIDTSNIVHNNKYDYSKVEYRNNRDKVCIICPEHGEFFISPYYHLKGRGCPKCSKIESSEKITSTKENFIINAKKIHGDKYDYSKVKYVNTHTLVTIICNEHGEFKQMPYSHLLGKGCVKCSNNLSKAEYEIIDFIGSDICEHSNKSILGGKEIDIYIPSKKIGIEFNGLKWHSEEFGKQSDYHLRKTEACEKNGIRLLHIFEDEWIYKKDIVKSRINNILNRTSHRIFARKCTITNVDSKTARDFIENNHIQGNCSSSYRYGLYYNGELVSLMTFGKLRRNLGSKPSEGSYELLRFCNKLDTTVVGGASKLLSKFIKEVSPNNIISYADRRWSNGNMYRELGFKFVHFSKPSYFYVIGNKRENRFKYRKDILVSKGYNNDKSEHQIMLERGIYRIYDCGTMLFEYKHNG